MNHRDACVARLADLSDLLERPPSAPLRLEPWESGGWSLSVTPSDDFAALHYRILGHELPPAASVFMDEKGMMGGQWSERTWLRMAQNGFQPDTNSISADHLSNSLRYLAALIDRGDESAASRFVQEELLGWTPVFLDRLSHSDATEMQQLSGVLTDSLLFILLDGGSERELDEDGFTLPEAGLRLDEERTNLSAIGTFLATHAQSGLYIPKSRLMTEARKHRLPTGFGSRSRTIEGLFRSAAQYEALADVCDFFDSEVALHRQVWEEWTAKGAGRWASEWQKKLDQTSRTIQTMRQAGS